MRSRGRFFLLLALASLTLAGARSARADSPADLAAAQALVDEGNRAAAAADYETALARFRAAYARYKGANVLLNIGTALRRLGREPEAGTVYEQYLRDPGANPERVAEIHRALAEIDRSVARVSISADDPAARFWLDGGELIGFHGGGIVRIAPGDHVVAAGHQAPEASAALHLSAGEARSVGLRVAPAAAAMPPVVLVEVPAEVPAEPRRRRPIGPMKAAAIALDVTGGLAIAGGLAASIVGLLQTTAAGDHCYHHGDACEPRALELQADARRSGQIAGVSYGVGAGLLLTGIIVGAVEPRFRDTGALRRAPRLSVAAGPAGGFVGVGASW